MPEEQMKTPEQIRQEFYSEMSKADDILLKKSLDEAIKIFHEARKILEPSVPSKTIDWKTLQSTEFPPVHYIVKPFFEAEAINVISAVPNSYKTWLMLYEAYHIAKGIPLFGIFDTEQNKVLIINEEDNLPRIKERYKEIGRASCRERV